MLANNTCSEYSVVCIIYHVFALVGVVHWISRNQFQIYELVSEIRLGKPLPPPSIRPHLKTSHQSSNQTQLPQTQHTRNMASKQATVASFVESAPPGEVGRNGLSN